jgi:hypothetical protein
MHTITSFLGILLRVAKLHVTVICIVYSSRMSTGVLGAR